MKATLFHIAEQVGWEIALDRGVYRPASLDREGFIHCSTGEQVLATAERLFAGRHDLLLLEIDPDEVEADIRYEPADGQLFPHIYGPLDLAAVIGTHPLEPRRDGRFTIPKTEI